MLVVVSSNVSSHRNEVHIYNMHAHNHKLRAHQTITHTQVTQQPYTYLQFANPFCDGSIHLCISKPWFSPPLRGAQRIPGVPGGLLVLGF